MGSLYLPSHLPWVKKQQGEGKFELKNYQKEKTLVASCLPFLFLNVLPALPDFDFFF